MAEDRPIPIAGGGRGRSSSRRPRASPAGPGPRRVVVAPQRDELDAAIGEPAPSGARTSAAGPAARPRATRPGPPRRPAGRSPRGRAARRASPASRPASARGRRRRPRRAPLVAQVDVGDDGRPLARDGRPPLPGRATSRRRLGRSRPSILGRPAAAWSRRRASAGDSNWSGSGAAGSIQAAANGEGPASVRKRIAGPLASQARAAGASSRSSRTSRRVSRSSGWSGQAALTRG